MTYQLLDLEDQMDTGIAVGLDGLQLGWVPMVPSIRLYLAQDSVVWWARMEAEAGHKLVAPFWASAWIGGQALARYVMDHPEVALGRRVLDLAAGSGLVGIAASLCGATSVTANDVDPNAAAVIALNARANDVKITVRCENMLDGDGEDADLIVAGDVFYSRALADEVMPFLRRATARGALVLVGDPGRDDLPGDEFETLATYSAASATTFGDAEIETVHVLRPR